MWTRRRRHRLAADWRLRHPNADAAPDLADLAPVARRSRHRAPLPRLPLAADALRADPSRRAAAIGAAAVGLLVAAMAFAEPFRVRGAEVAGSYRSPAETPYAASGLEGRHVLACDPGVAARRIEGLADVRRATVRLSLPARVRIEIEETRPLFTWISPAGQVVVDERGIAIALPPDQAALAAVTAGGGPPLHAGDKLPAALVEAARDYVAMFGSLEYREDVGFVARTPEGWEVRLGDDAGRAERQGAILAGMREHLARVAPAVAFVDLRYESRPYYRLRGGGAPP